MPRLTDEKGSADSIDT